MLSLPGYVTDLVRDGVPPVDLKQRGERAVWSALLRTAASAMQHGWTRVDWLTFVSEPGSHLGTQARLKRGTKARTEVDFARQLDKAWTKAEKWLAERPAAMDAVQIHAAIRDVRGRVEHPDADLSDTERRVLLVACSIAAEKNTTRPAMPRRVVAERAGLNERTTRTAMAALCGRGLLHLEVRGRGGADAGKRRANLYRLPDAVAIHIPVPVNGSMGRTPQVYGTSGVGNLGTREQVYGTSRRVRLTIEADDAESLNKVLDRLAESAGVVAVEDDADDLSGTAHVVPLRGRRAS